MLSLRVAFNSAAAVFRGLFFSPGFPRYAADTQLVAASAVTAPVFAMVDGLVKRVRVVTGVAPAAGESMSINVTRFPTGGSVLEGGAFVLDDTKEANTVYDLELVDGAEVAEGGGLVVTRIYVAGGGPAMTATSVEIETYGDQQP